MLTLLKIQSNRGKMSRRDEKISVFNYYAGCKAQDGAEGVRFDCSLVAVICRLSNAAMLRVTVMV